MPAQYTYLRVIQAHVFEYISPSNNRKKAVLDRLHFIFKTWKLDRSGHKDSLERRRELFRQHLRFFAVGHADEEDEDWKRLFVDCPVEEASRNALNHLEMVGKGNPHRVLFKGNDDRYYQRNDSDSDTSWIFAMDVDVSDDEDDL